MKLYYGQSTVVVQAVDHVKIVDNGPKVIRIVWIEQKALKHTNTCMG